MDAEGKYLYYVLFKQRGRQNVKLNSDIHNDSTAGNDIYLKTRQNTLNILNQYTNPTVPRNSGSRVNSFAQRTGDRRNPQTYEKAYCKDKECYNCHKEGHPYSHCPNKKKKRINDNNKSNSSKESKTIIKTCPKI